MAEFTAVNPRRRSRSYSNDSARGYNLTSESAQEPPTKKQKKAEDSGPESDKENIPKTPTDSVDHVYEFYETPATVIDGEMNDAFSESRIFDEANKKETGQEFLYEPSGSHLRNDSVVPEHLLVKKYDTRPPDAPRRDQILAAAERLVAVRTKRALVSDSDTDSEYNYDLGRTSKRRKKENSKQLHPVKPRRILTPQSQKIVPDNVKSNTSSKKKTPSVKDRAAVTRTIIDGRIMITASKTASKMQKLVPGFPLPQDPFPEDFTLTELCAQYPNHLFGDNLHPFLQYTWSPAKIAKLLPDQSQVAEEDRVTANAIASRLRKAKIALEKWGRYSSLMNGPKTHAELWNNTSEREVMGTDMESKDPVEQTDVAKESESDDENESVEFTEDNETTIA